MSENIIDFREAVYAIARIFNVDQRTAYAMIKKLYIDSASGKKKEEIMFSEYDTEVTENQQKSDNYKPFNLEAATRGEPIIHVAMPEKQCEFIAHVPGCAYEFVIKFQDRNHIDVASEMSLRMAPKKKTVWINLYKHQQYNYVGGVYDTLEEANNNNADQTRVGNRAWPLEIEE